MEWKRDKIKHDKVKLESHNCSPSHSLEGSLVVIVAELMIRKMRLVKL